MDFGDDQDFVTFDIGSAGDFDDFDFSTPENPPVNQPNSQIGMKSVSPMLSPTVITSVEQNESATSQQLRNVAVEGNISEEIEPPLLEELGIDFSLITKRIISRLNPFGSIEAIESDVIGSLFFGLLLGVSILLTGKFRFGYVFGFTIIGSLAEYFILNLLSNKDIDYFVVLTNLGYSSYPLVLLGIASLFVSNITILIIIAIFAIVWCTYASSRLFTTLQEIVDKKILVAYPMALYFILFVLLVMC
ncbi:golgi membrane protein, putative [Entamoeba nuttalli P19]|uniref:Protein YIPF n=1 Tax=Entamoeba nuttalli (strain P19) TaxID=1076696 RepID=K2HT65_ENTNP|nr:golgi membrane protein, putative [Entamoeba nuttalli P19]EKE39315.1 golgi membrane protein, putative [Entamoeba nuttalli P19]|eukprot:XP_008858352.1 golgi membrane protein, putative [Entamoeba nuttalli P19]